MRGKSYMNNLTDGLLPALVQVTALDSATQAFLHSWVLMTITERNAFGWQENPALEGNQVSVVHVLGFYDMDYCSPFSLDVPKQFL